MTMYYCCALTAAMLTLTTLVAPDAALGAVSATSQIIVLKFDDVINQGGNPGPRWQRLADYLEKGHVKANFGIICVSLEKDDPAYFNWIKDRQKNGMVEFWLHGYNRRKAEDKGEFEEGTFEEQKALLEKCEMLAKKKLGFALTAFGPHWSGTTEETDKAVQAIPELKIWLYGPKNSKFYKKVSLVRVMGIESQVGVPDFDKFKTNYEKIGYKQEVMALQGHPGMWDDERWEQFTKIIEFLKSKGCVFMTASEYLASLTKDVK